MTETAKTNLDEIFERLPPLALSAFDTQFKSNRNGVLSGEFPALPRTQLEKISDVIVDGGSEQWRQQIASRAVMMPVSSLFKHLAKLTAENANAYRFPRIDRTAEAVADLLGPEVQKRFKYKPGYSGRFVRAVFREPALIVRLGPVWSDALTTYLDDILKEATKGPRLDTDTLTVALDKAVFVPGEITNLAALATAVTRLPLAVEAKLLDASIVDVDDLRLPLMSSLLMARVLANCDSTLNRWLTKPLEDGDE